MLSASPVPGISEIPPSAEKEAHCSRAPDHSRRSREPLSRCHRLQSPGSRLQPLNWPTGSLGPLGQPPLCPSRVLFGFFFRGFRHRSWSFAASSIFSPQISSAQPRSRSTPPLHSLVSLLL